MPADKDFAPIQIDANFFRKHLWDLESSEGYYVVYPDGYTSWSPVTSFESGYVRVPDPAACTKCGEMIQHQHVDPDGPAYIPLPTEKTLHNSDISGARQNVPDIKVVGDGDLWQLLCKASSEREGWMKSTKAMEIPTHGCLVQITTQQKAPDGSYAVAEAIQFVPGVTIVPDDNNGRRLSLLVPETDKLTPAKGSTGSDNPFLWQKKAVFVEAFQWNELTAGQIAEGIIPDGWPKWLRKALAMRSNQQGAVFQKPSGETRIHTLEGDHAVTIGDFIIQGIQGELYPCKPDIFEATYKKA